MTQLVDFKVEHLTYIKDTGMHDVKMKSYIVPERFRFWEDSQRSYTLLENGLPVLVGGILEFWKGRGEAWLIFGQPSKHCFPTIVKILKRRLEFAFSFEGFKRMEMVVDYDFKEGHRLAKIMGFEKEADRLKKYMHHGGDVTLYAMVK